MSKSFPKPTTAGRTASASQLANNGLVKIENDGGRLRLRFSYGDKRYAMAIGLPDSAINRLVAQKKASQIELDIGYGNFDPTLKRYKPRKGWKKASEARVAGLIRKFMQEQTKAKGLEKGSLCRYDAVLKHLENFFNRKDTESMNETDARAFVAYLRTRVSERSVKDYIILVQSCWSWAAEALPEDPWQSVLKQIKPASKQKVKPFTSEEVQRILEGFVCNGVASPVANGIASPVANRHYRHYTDFVTFLFGTGCRLEKWLRCNRKHLANDYTTVSTTRPQTPTEPEM